jgi:hypothetical protein
MKGFNDSFFSVSTIFFNFFIDSFSLVDSVDNINLYINWDTSLLESDDSILNCLLFIYLLLSWGFSLADLTFEDFLYGFINHSDYLFSKFFCCDDDWLRNVWNLFSVYWLFRYYWFIKECGYIWNVV